MSDLEKILSLAREQIGVSEQPPGSPDFDCSSFVISAYEASGIPVKSAGSSYTGNMPKVALKTDYGVVSWLSTPELKLWEAVT